MRNWLAPCLYAAVAWWFTTGAILYLDGRAARTFRWSLCGASVVLVAALYELQLSASDQSVSAAYAAFSCAILVWGWLEMSFLMGFITGPRRSGCHGSCAGWRHFVHASQAVIYNELAIAVAAGAIWALTREQPNRLALWIFLILWAMRLSAKLNLHLGVPNLGEGLLPSHLQYLKSFFRKRTMNVLFPLSITGSTAVLALTIERSARAHDEFTSVSLSLAAALLALAIIEHWFMVLPLPSERLWTWALHGGRVPSQNPLAASDSPVRQ